MGVLGLEAEKVSVAADFFHLGRNSIMAIKLANRIQKEMGCGVTVGDIFKYKTIREIAKNLKDRDEGVVTIKPIVFEKAKELVLSFAQGRLWFLDRYEGGSNVYNIPMVYKIREGVDAESLKKSIREIVMRHEVVRSVIKTGAEGNVYQEAIDEDGQSFEIGERDPADKEELKGELRKEVNHIFKLDRDYPIRVTLYGKDTERCICMVIHHIAFDGWSQDIFLCELAALYRYYREGETGRYPLEEARLQYKDYAVWQRKYLRGAILEDQVGTGKRSWKDMKY